MRDALIAPAKSPSTQPSRASSTVEGSSRTSPSDFTTNPRKSGPFIVGLYGVSGAGKTYLLDQKIQTSLHQHMNFIDGSTLIDATYRLSNFKSWSIKKQNEKRIELMRPLIDVQKDRKKGIILGGHLLFWNEGDREPRNVGTDADWEAYTHIVYLQVDTILVQKRRQNDKVRIQGAASIEHLDQWQTRERVQLRRICFERQTSFTTFTEHETTPAGEVLERLQQLLKNFWSSNESNNREAVNAALEAVMSSHDLHPQTMMVLDADKTLAPQDTGTLFWRFLSGRMGMPNDPLKPLA